MIVTTVGSSKMTLIWYIIIYINVIIIMFFYTKLFFSFLIDTLKTLINVFINFIIYCSEWIDYVRQQ
jgi:hypothetical protein